MRIAFPGISPVVEVPDCPVFLGILREAAPGWPFSESGDTSEPLARVEARADRYAVFSPWYGHKEFEVMTAVRAACALLADVVTQHIDENPAQLSLHCGSAMSGGRLVVFPSRSHAGKSTLIGRLAADGWQIFGDDVLPLDGTDMQGVALGLAPRLRLPLPDHASADFRRFIADNAGPSDHCYHYLSLPGTGLAPRGMSAPLGAIVLLDRQAGAAAEMGPAGRAETLKALITQNFTRADPAAALLARLHRLMDRVPRFTLRYSDLDEAAALLRHSFAAWPPPIESSGRFPSRSPGGRKPAAERDAPALPPGLRWRQAPEITLRVVDEEAFLTGAEDDAIHHLDSIGTGLWRLLADGVTPDEAADVLHGAFPDTDRAKIAADTAALFADLAAAGFIRPEPGRGMCRRR